MSVPCWKRKVNLLAVEMKAIQLLEYTIRTSKSQKNFPLRYKSELSLPVVELARKIYYLTILADKTPVTNTLLIKQRREYFIEAIRTSWLLKSEINMNMWAFSLKVNKADYWIKLVDDWKRACDDWLKSDYKKHGETCEKVND